MRALAILLALTLSGCASTVSDPDASADGEADGGTSERIVFVTAAIQDADFGGPEGADALCASEARAAGLEGEFRAWLSTLDSPVANRLDQSAVPYVLVDGTRIAEDWADLTDGSILAPIDLDAAGREQTGDVWTGTLPDAQPYLGGDCDGFTSGAADIISLCGTTRSAAANWTENQTPRCDTALHLFCFEQ